MSSERPIEDFYPMPGTYRDERGHVRPLSEKRAAAFIADVQDINAKHGMRTVESRVQSAIKKVAAWLDRLS